MAGEMLILGADAAYATMARSRTKRQPPPAWDGLAAPKANGLAGVAFLGEGRA
jgi:hypothetical protein